MLESTKPSVRYTVSQVSDSSKRCCFVEISGALPCAASKRTFYNDGNALSSAVSKTVADMATERLECG